MYRQKNFPIHVIFPRNDPDEANKFLAYVRGQSPELCKHAVNHSYITEQTRDEIPDRLYIVKEETMSLRGGKKKIQLYGFAFVYATNNTWYIDVICANKVGTSLIRRIQSDARKTKKINFVTLSALPDVISFYGHLGFVNGPGFAVCGVQETKERLYNLKVRKETLSSFLQWLINKQFVRNKGCTTVETCEGDGFPMTWCVRKQ